MHEKKIEISIESRFRSDLKLGIKNPTLPELTSLHIRVIRQNYIGDISKMDERSVYRLSILLDYT